MVHPSAIPDEQLLADCATRRQRRSGPGGQHRNKVETAVVITHTPSGLQGEASERRSQHENQRAALFRLRVNLALRIRTPRHAAATPSQLWRSRCAGGRISINPRHDDFPSLLAEVLDVLHDHDLDARAASRALGCSTSQLLKFLKLEPRAFQQFNQQRIQRGLSTLR